MNIEGATLDETADDDRDSTSLIGRGSHRTGCKNLFITIPLSVL